MSPISRREMLGSLGTLAAAGGWIGLTSDKALAQAPAAGAADRPREYVLPALGYAFDALEPHIDAQTMELHHDKHHAAYVKGLNTALQGLDSARQSGSEDAFARVRELTESLAFNGSGHTLHCVFWKNMKKGGGGEPKGVIAKAIDRDFGGFSRFQAHFIQASTTVQGGGWGVLGWEPLSGRLLVSGAEKHQNGTVWGVVPLLVLDVWEHAYYLKYQNQRAKYLTAFWNVIDWDNVSERLSMAQKLTA